jgi:hypothetical protein
MHGERAALVRVLDEAILGLRPRPSRRPASLSRALAS